ncbi:type VI secretion system Vgr family protein [Cronobacter dublinensis]|uniref:type VI secretion system Vgr family protein n=1 Tax=Cronobacter dublinensis TaxID=413497 RepID=UPI0013763472|nr:type VI secretion system Vgr family protein [Cronobacter dublinensis]EKY3090578.1 type VI secretion system tip protein VgrG [Cronobacter dublinensis]ELQ6228367.1 type VI secretion system tip protein VgrG [Cronobacter dublinensis]ELY4006452.1 type VI secretion system tip protein VgrG [Cronobacter dublinensis]ELY4408073.1 type VI secretion system tip protein VgrG [Cronobacter dublinensis]ELY5819042.1 type VI secretion system tip protein VgrG [Cronobacter dublinensis]
MNTLQKQLDGQIRYWLEINNSRVTPDVLNFRGREALNEPFTWRIVFTTPQRDVTDTDVLLKYASLSMRSGRVVHGIITGFEWLGTTADQTHYAVTLSSRLSLLNLTRRCAVYQNLSVPELVEQVLRTHGLEGPDFHFRLERVYPPRDLITQWRETDLAFIRRVLSEVGIWFRSEMNAATQQETVILGDSQLNCAFGVSVPFQEPSGLYDGAEASVWDVRVWHHTVTGEARTRDYNYRDASMPMDSAAAVRSAAITTGEHYRYGAPFLAAGDDAISAPETESGAFYARIHHERELNKATRLHLFSNAAHLTPGQVLETPGSSLAALQEGMLITLATFRAARDTRLHVSLWGIPYSERVNYRPAELIRPEIHGTLPARIESREPHDTYAHLDSAGRYRVKLDFSREDAEPGYHYLWVRLAKPFAGENFGWHMPLLDGTEVSIAYDGGNIDRPYIAHAFHDAEHADLVNRDNRSQNILRTAADNTLRMEDRRGQEHVTLNTPYGATQLNQGQIVDQQDKTRGCGFELRTDEYGVIRVAKGLFITADGQTKAQGEVLERETALQEIEHCLTQLRQLAAAAEQAQALEADIASQLEMFDARLTPLNDMIHVHGPQGVAFTSGEHLQMTASQNVAVNAGGDISLGSMGNTTLMAGDKIGLFAHTGTLSVISGEGPVQMQAQNGAMSLGAQQKVSLVSTADMLFAGKKKITLIGGGSYLKIEEGSIEYGTTETYLRRVERTYVGASQDMPVTVHRVGTAYIYSAIYQLRDRHGNILANTPYRLTTPSGQTIAGFSDSEGYSVPVYTPQQEEVALHIVPKTASPEEPMWFIGETTVQQLETELRENPS